MLNGLTGVKGISIRLDLPVPFAPRMKSICPASTVSAIAPSGLPVGIDNENDTLDIHLHLVYPLYEALLAEQCLDGLYNLAEAAFAVSAYPGRRTLGICPNQLIWHQLRSNNGSRLPCYTDWIRPIIL